MRLVLNLIAPILLVCAMDIPAQAGPLAGVATVVDGDTIKIDGQSIRLHGIDAPDTAR